VTILLSFLTEIKQKGYVDFSASGTALLSSSTIHRMKSELVLKLEEPPKLPEKKVVDFVPPPLPAPFRFEYTLTSLSEVIDSLISSLENEQKMVNKQQTIFDSIEMPAHQPDDFFIQIEEQMDKLYSDLIQTNQNTKEPISFSKYTIDMSHIEKVRIFILVIFLAHKNLVFINQIEQDLMVQPLLKGDS
jgi:segregation and condensation protein A